MMTPSRIFPPSNRLGHQCGNKIDHRVIDLPFRQTFWMMATSFM